MGDDYAYSLEKYHGPGSRYTCPKCGKPRCFVRYVDKEGRYLADEVGRCNREDSCGYHYPPREYFADHPEAGRPFVPRRQTPAPFRFKECPPVVPVECYTIPPGVIKDLYRRDQRQPGCPFQCAPTDNNFAGWLYRAVGADAFAAVMKRYHLGTWGSGWGNAVIFWYIDAGGRIRTGKTMHYRQDGHRDKERYPNFMHAILDKKAPGALPEGWKLRRCLFGGHLLPEYPEATVCLVESEKTAVYSAARLMNGGAPAVWLGAGGKQYLNADTCQELKGRKVVAFPDLGAFTDWRNVLDSLAREIGFTVIVSDLLEGVATEQQREKGLDIADFI